MSDVLLLMQDDYTGLWSGYTLDELDRRLALEWQRGRREAWSHFKQSGALLEAPPANNLREAVYAEAIISMNAIIRKHRGSYDAHH